MYTIHMKFNIQNKYIQIHKNQSVAINLNYLKKLNYGPQFHKLQLDNITTRIKYSCYYKLL